MYQITINNIAHIGRTSSWDDNTTGSHSSNWDDKNSVMGNLTGNASSTSSWDAQTPNAWQQQQKNKQIMGSATGHYNDIQTYTHCVASQFN